MSRENVFYRGFYVKKSKFFTTTFVVGTDTGYIVTDPVYRSSNNAKYDTYSEGEGIVLVDPANKFFVFAKKDDPDCVLTQKEQNLVKKEIMKLTNANEIVVHTFSPNYKDTDHLIPIFRNFNTMRTTLEKFMEKVDIVSKMNNLKVITDDGDTPIDHQHIVIKKSFDEEYYKVGHTYSIQMHDHPNRKHIITTTDYSDDFVTGFLYERSDDSMDFIIIQPNAVNAVRITFGIEDVEKYKVVFKKHFDEDDVMKIISDVAIYTDGQAQELVGPSQTMVLRIINKEDDDHEENV